MKSKLQELAEAEDYQGILPSNVGVVLQSMMAAASILDSDRLEEYIENLKRGHTIAPFLDPTAYMMGSRNLEDNIAAACLIRDFKKGIEKLRLRALGL